MWLPARRCAAAVAPHGGSACLRARIIDLKRVRWGLRRPRQVDGREQAMSRG